MDVIGEGPQEMVGTEVWGAGSELGTARDGARAE